MNKKKAFIPMSVLIGALLLALVAAMTPFVAEPDVAHAQSADATLSALTVAGAPTGTHTPPAGVTYDTLAPVFAATTKEYKVRIPFVQSGVVVTPTAAETDSIIRVNGQVVASAASHNVSVASAIGSEFTITIHVQAPLRSVSETYTVKVYRERKDRSDNKNLASLGVSGASLSPAFTPGTISYKARVQAASVTLSYRLSDTGGGASVGTVAVASTGGGEAYDSATKKVTLGAAAAATAATGGTTTITVPVTAEDGTSQDYTIEIYRIRANRETTANLATLGLTAIGGVRVGDALALTTDPAAAGFTTDYKERMDTDTTHVTVAATVADAGATFAISPSDANAAEEGHQVALTAGAETTITITVTAEDTARRQAYTVKVYRERATKSNDNNLNSLSLSMGTLTPAFNRDTEDYTAQVAHNVEKVTVSYAASDTAGGSSVAVTVTGGTASVSGKEVTLADAGIITVITVTVTPESGATADPAADPPLPGSKEYEIRLYRLRELPSANASLSGITITPSSAGTLDPVFSATTKMYKVKVANNVASITIGGSAADVSNGATVAITPKRGMGVDLTAGMETLITIMVTAEDRTTTDTYTVRVYRERATKSDDATLSALSLSAGMLSPAFMSDTIEYKARVANSVDKVTVSSTPSDNAGGVGIMRATSTDADCSSTGDNTAVTTDAISLLTAGNNTNICVNVTAEDGSTKSYLIQVYRLRVNPSVDDSLSAFTITEATNSVNITTGVSSATPADHTLVLLGDNMNMPDVAYRVRQVTVTATADDGAVVTILPADANTAEPGHQVDLSVGAETTITVLVQPEDSSVPSKAHTANVYRKNIPGTESKDATLSSLMLSGAVLSPAFASATEKYTAAAANSTELTTVTAMATHIGAQSSIVTGIMPPDANADMAGHQVSLMAGQEATITVVVTAEDGTTMKTYTVKVTRAAEESSDATLSSLMLSGLTLMPEFDPATTAYTAEIDFLETTTVEAMATHHAAMVEGTGEKTLVVGDNMISVMVTAEDESTQTYTVTVTVRRGETLLQRYDENNNGRIDLSEARMAVDDYLFNDVLTKEQAQEVVNLYLFG